ncbi:MAG: hypothetical protein DRJ07_00225 [Bacteroidetes bacterium]|nr:MAG: hypothetical protein DRJ07_00225 [Bacteroidota bacterium]
MFLFMIVNLFSAYAQYGADGAVVLGGIISTAILEQGHLDDIESDQERILISSAVIALETAALAAVEKKLLDGLSEVDDIINSAKIILKIYKYTEDIFAWQEKTFEVVKEKPELLSIATEQEIKLIREVAYLMNDLIIATKKSETNLLNNKNRLDIMRMVLSEILELRDSAQKFYYLLKGASYMDILAQLGINNLNFQMDYQKIYNEALINYNTIFKQ